MNLNVAPTDALWKYRQDYAVFLPSLNSAWIETVSSSFEDLRPPEHQPGRVPSADVLNFLKPPPHEEGQFWWPRALRAPDPLMSIDELEKKHSAILRRNRRRSFILCDSGGYQTLTGQWMLHDWDDENEVNAWRDRICRWQEAVGDAAIVWDIPSRIVDPTEPHSYFKTVEQARNYSAQNARWWASNCSMPLLNTLHGPDFAAWYEAVKIDDKKFIGWAIPTLHKDFTIVLQMVRFLWERGEIQNGTHLHFLGQMSPHLIIGYTAIKRALKQKLGSGSSVEVTFDSSSAFQSAAIRQETFTHTWDEWVGGTHSFVVGKEALSENDSPDTDVIREVLGHEFGPANLRRPGKRKDLAVDEVSVALLAANSVKTVLVAMLEAMAASDALLPIHPARFMRMDIGDLLSDLAAEWRSAGKLDEAKRTALALRLDDMGLRQVGAYGTIRTLTNSLGWVEWWKAEIQEAVHQYLAGDDSVLEWDVVRKWYNINRQSKVPDWLRDVPGNEL